jgi:hypothetical protein
MDAYIECVVTRSTFTFDQVTQLCSDLGAHTLRSLTAWWNSLSSEMKYFLGLVAASSAAAAGKIFAKVVGAEAAEILIIALGFFGWGVLIGALADCSGLIP